MNNLQFPKFQGNCFILFEVILTGVEGLLFKHISYMNYILKHSVNNLN